MAVGDLSFAFDPSKGETPQTVARKRLMAEAILGNTSHAPRDIGEGLNAIGQALMYRNLMKGVTGAETAGNSGAAKVFGSLFGDQFPSAPALSASPPASAPAPTSGDHPVPPADVGTTGATDLAPEQKALLNTIAGPESGGRYDIMYGGKKFDSFADHPRVAVPITSGPNAGQTSSAAGKYQFLGSTWDDQAKKLGLTDFSPANQDKAAWNLASETYKAKTGQDLDAILKSGDPQAIAGVGSTLKGIWTSLPGGIEQGTNTNRFVATYQKALGNGATQAQAQQIAQQEQAAAPVQVASNDASIGMSAPSDAVNPLASLGVPFTGKPKTDAERAAIQAQMEPALAQVGQPYSPPPMPQPYAAIHERAASLQPPMDAKAAISRALAGQGSNFPPELGPQDITVGPTGPSITPPEFNAQSYAPQQPATDAKQAILQALSGQGAPIAAQVPPMSARNQADLNDYKQGESRYNADAATNQQIVADPRQAVLQAMIGQNAAPVPPDMQTASAGPVVPPPMPAPANPGAPHAQMASTAPMASPQDVAQDRPIASAPEPDLSQLPAMAGGNADVVAPGSNGPTVQQLMQAGGDPWVMQKYGPVVEALIQQKMKQGDPGYALDLAKKKMDLQLEQQQLGGAFRGDSIDAQAWNILQTRDPSSKEYQTAYSIVSQPKMQMVQTANGMVQVQVPPTLPGWLKTPGAAGGPGSAPEGAAPNAAQAAPGLTAPAGSPAAAGAPPLGGTATASAPIPGTKQPATETQARNGAIGKILLGEVPTLGANFKALADPKGQLLNALPGGIGNAWQDPAYQRAANAVKASVSNVLYSLSGASSNPGEVLNQISILTPAFGDAPETINDKLQRFKTYVRAISSEANDPELTKSVETAISQMDMPAAPDQNQQAAPGAAPKAGTVDGGYRFKGGDPADKSNWEPVQ
jgi:muramidase (phage lysozyme)